jgi:hypothetical protein
MRRTFNSTGRKRFPQTLVNLRLVEHGGSEPRSFTAHFSDLSKLELPGDAKVYVEPYAGSSSARFDFGTVSRIRTPDDTRLTEIDEGAGVLFRVKIVDESGDIGKILSAANGIAARDQNNDGGRKPLLPIRHTDLGEELWQLEIGRDSGPHLLVNNRVPGLADLIVSNNINQGLVLPAAIRQVIRELLQSDEELEWIGDWKQYCETLVGESIDWDIDPELQDEEVDELVKRVTRKFVDSKRYGSNARQLMGEFSDG